MPNGREPLDSRFGTVLRGATWLCALALSGCLPHVPLHPYLTSPSLAAHLETIDGLDLPETEATIDDSARDSGDLPAPTSELDLSPEPTDSVAEEEIPAPAPDSIDLPLEAARAAALANNLDLRIELINPEIARAGISAEIGRFESTFTTEIGRNRRDLPPGFGAGGSPDTAVGTVVERFDVPLLHGGRVRLEHETVRSNPQIAGLDSTYDTALGVDVTQPLLRGAGFAVNTAPIQIASAQTGIASSRAKLTAISVLAEVERAYWRLYGARRQLQVENQQLEIARQVLQDTLRRIELNAIPASQTPRAEQLRAESGLASRQNAYLVAETELRLAERDLKRIMLRPDLPVDGHTALKLATEPDPKELRLDRKNLVARAIENRMEMLELQLQLLITDINIAVEDNSKLPRLDLRANYRALGFDRTLGKSIDTLFNGEFSDRLLLLALEVPLSGNVTARSRLHQAVLRQAQTRAAQERLVVAFRQEVNDAADRFEINFERVQATRLATEINTATYEAEQRVHANGQINATQLLEAAQNIAIAQSEEIRSLVDHQISKVDLAVAAGAVLGYGQIVWHR